MSAAKFPFMSVVVIGYNSAAIAPRALASLSSQDYPKDRYEIIFVNDGSTDNTADVAAAYSGVTVVNLPENVGIAAARNAGMRVAKGDVYVAFDSGCVAAPSWLSELARGYRLDAPAGVGGVIVAMHSDVPKGIATKFLEASRGGAGRVDATRFAGLPGPFRRLLTYLGSGLARRNDSTPLDYEEVDELYGANGSFPMEILHAVGGWDENMAAPAIGGIEDRDLCTRIRKQFPNHYFYTMQNATMMHDPSTTLSKYLLRPYRRGPFNYLFHVKNGLTPPIFPFPPLALLLLLATLVIMPLATPVVLLLIPQILYFWWAQRAVIERSPLYVLFPYLQLAEETMVIIGLARGFMMHNRKQHADT